MELALFHKLFHQPEFFLRIRVIPHRKIEPCRFFDDAACVRERVEALFAVIAAHAAVSYAAEGHVCSSKMDDRVVDAAAAEGAGIQHAAFGCLVRREQIQCQRLFPAADERP